jgi:alkylation response protein AidB-like acyl-CoA dehydrogenase
VSALDTPEARAFRDEVRAFIAAHAPRIPVRAGFRSPDDADEDRLLRDWRAALYRAGYLGAEWPEELGGRGQGDPVRDLILAEELSAADLPPLGDQTHLAAFALLRFGTAEQQRAHLPGIRDGSETWCQLFSEPEAGSDLGALRTRARRDDDGAWIVNGQKVWSSNAEWSDYGFLIARTGAQDERHRVITAFIVDMRAPGIDLRPIREITGSSDFSEVFFDDVRLPADAVLGAVDDGWRVTMDSLGAERSGIGAGAARLRRMLAELSLLAGDDPVERRRIGAFAARVEVCNQLAVARFDRELAGVDRVADIPIGKLAYSELNLELAEYGVRLQGARSLLVGGDAGAVDGGRWQDEYLYARTYTVAGGASEIMRNVIAERALGMPREPRGA